MAAFQGFQPHDFGANVYGTHWRHRRALGGELRRRLRRIFGRRYQTWAQPGASVLHIARRAVYAFPSPQAQVCLFVATTPDTLRWGWQCPLRGDALKRLQGQAGQSAAALVLMLHLLHAYALTLSDPADDSGGLLGGCWRFDDGELTWREACSLPRPALPQEIFYRLSDAAAAAGETSVIALTAQASPQIALQWRGQAAGQLLPALSALVPLYELCVSPS